MLICREHVGFENVANVQQNRQGVDNNLKINRNQSPTWALPWAPWTPAQEIRKINAKSHLDFKYLARDFISRARYLKFRFDLACFSLMDDFITDLSLDYFTARVATGADVGKMYSHTACIPNALPWCTTPMQSLSVLLKAIPSAPQSNPQWSMCKKLLR